MATIIVLAGIGFLLVMVEMFLPGGVLGVLGGMFLIGAIVTGYVKLGLLGGTVTFCVVAVACLVGLFIWMAVFPKTPVGRKLILSQNLEKGADLPGVASLVGREGVAQTPLRPSGKATIEGERVDVVAESHFIEAGEAVAVVLAEGSRVVVRKKVGMAGNPA